MEPLLRSIAEATDVPYRVMFATSDQATIDELTRLGASFIVDEGGDDGSYPKRINRLYKTTTEPYILLAADDLAFRAGWFQAALALQQSLDGVVGINDLHNAAGVHFLVSRNYIETLGGCIGEPGVVLHEGYRHCYCDDELRHTAISRGRWAWARDSVIEHLHHAAGKSHDDNVYAIGASSMAQGAAVFQSRSHLWQLGG
jgi:hypothetical protein